MVTGSGALESLNIFNATESISMNKHSLNNSTKIIVSMQT